MAILIGVTIVIIRLLDIENNKMYLLEETETIINFKDYAKREVIFNDDQIVEITCDGLTAYNHQGEEVWSDTLNLESIVVEQKDPYFIVFSKMSRKLSVFNESGKKQDIETQNPILYASVNKKGQVAVVETIPEGHVLTTYKEDGSEGVKRGTYIESSGYPMTAEITPDGSYLLVSYMDTSKVEVTSSIKAIGMNKPTEENMDNVIYGITQEGNLVYDIEWISDKDWIALGDRQITWYTIEGEEEGKQEGLYVQQFTRLVKQLGQMRGYLPLIASKKDAQSSVHSEETLYYFNAQGEVLLEEELEGKVTYFYADGLQVVLGVGREYTGYSRLGKKNFSYRATQDIQKLVYFNKSKKAIAVTKDRVMVLRPKKQEKERNLENQDNQEGNETKANQEDQESQEENNAEGSNIGEDTVKED